MDPGVAENGLAPFGDEGKEVRTTGRVPAHVVRHGSNVLTRARLADPNAILATGENGASETHPTRNACKALFRAALTDFARYHLAGCGGILPLS
jgi:hypothetical protein